MRKIYIDNLRSAAILLLFAVHTFMIWNDFGAGFYVWAGESRILSTLIVVVNPWFMPLLFVLAGMSARYALERRSSGEFMRQRVRKLLVPFLGGIILLVPVQTLYARKFFQNYNGGFFDNLKYFFTHLTDFNGYDGAFTPSHLWFILFLFIISAVALIVFKLIPYEKASGVIKKLPGWVIPFLFIPIWLMYYIGNFGGFSIGKNFALYLAGYYVLSDESIMDKLDKSRRTLTALCLAETVFSAALYGLFAYYGDLWVNYIGWNTILVILVWGRRLFNKRTRFTDYFSGASYPIYILHQTILVVLAYYIFKLTENAFVCVPVIIAGSFVLTVAAYELIRRIPYVRKLVGMK